MNNSNLDNRKSSTGRNPKKGNDKDEMSPMAGRLMLILGYMQEFQGALNLKDLYNSAIDAVLSITGMDRGYGFLIEYNQDQMSLKEVTSRKKGKDFFEKDYTISKSMLKKVIKANGAVLIDNADTSIESTMSMRDFKIKSLVCLPLMLYDKETKKEILRGIIYADKMMAGKLKDHARTTLQMLTELIAVNIDRCLKFQDMQTTWDSYNEFFKDVANELNIIKDNMDVISKGVKKATDEKEMATLTQHLKDQNARINEIVNGLTT
ncbi:MAG: hypothetical protein NE328_23865 [Lentisphaeraceae bacterium]|nr:hypothetical protein [Lentisphaeraceae bacterium]